MAKESWTVVFNARAQEAEPNTPAGTKVLTEGEALPPQEIKKGIIATIFDTTTVAVEAGSAAEAIKTVRQLYRWDSGVAFAVKTSAVTWESI